MDGDKAVLSSDIAAVSESGAIRVGDDQQYDLRNLALSDVVRCGYVIRQLAGESRSMEDVVNRIVNHLFATCRNPETGESDLALVRFFKTHPFGDLDESLQKSALALAPDGKLDDSTKCLVLLGTAGERPGWNNRQQSQGHQAIPLLSEATVSQIPMIAQLVRQFGLELSSVVAPQPELLVEMDERNYNVFHVEDAVDSPYIPAQDEFVKQFGVQSVLGFGGMLPTGNLYSVIMFSKAKISRTTAEIFRTIALKIKATILPYEEVAVFRERALSGSTFMPEADRQLSILRSKIAALEELEGVYDRMVFGQSGRLEQVVRDVDAANHELQQEMENRQRAEQEREKLNDELVVASRQAGMAEIAIGVLHNVGNVLNGVNVSASLMKDLLTNSKRARLGDVVKILNENSDDLGEFITNDKRGKHLPDFLSNLGGMLERESQQMGDELNSLMTSVEHLKTIVGAQQSYATLAGVRESVSVVDVIDDALKIATPSLERHGVELERDYEDGVSVTVDKQKLMQILINLISNAKNAVLETSVKERRVTLRVSVAAADTVVVEVGDTGVGVAAENLSKIFNHGFTTRKNRGGHGFGLHHSANSAVEMGGQLSVSSEGLGKGATFRLQLPQRQDIAAEVAVH